MARAVKQIKLWDRQEKTVVHRLTAKEMQQRLDDREARQYCVRCRTVMAQKRTCNGLAQPHVWKYIATDKFFTKESHETAASLTAADSRGNVGLEGRSAQKTARQRIRFWRETGCDKSPLPTVALAT